MPGHTVYYESFHVAPPASIGRAEAPRPRHRRVWADADTRFRAGEVVGDRTPLSLKRGRAGGSTRILDLDDVGREPEYEGGQVVAVMTTRLIYLYVHRCRGHDSVSVNASTVKGMGIAIIARVDSVTDAARDGRPGAGRAGRRKAVQVLGAIDRIRARGRICR